MSSFNNVPMGNAHQFGTTQNASAHMQNGASVQNAGASMSTMPNGVNGFAGAQHLPAAQATGSVEKVNQSDEEDGEGEQQGQQQVHTQPQLTECMT